MNKQKLNKKIIVPAAIFCAAAVIIILIGAVCSGKTGVVCYISGEPVYEEEVAIAADRVELTAKQEYAEASGQKLGDIDYSRLADGKNGYEYIAEEVEAELIRIKTIQIEARQHGLCDEISYPELEKARAKENEDRANTKEEGGVVYGVVSFDDEEYYRYLIDNLDLQNKRYLIQNDVLTAEEEEVKAAYDRDPSAFDNQEYDSVSMFVKNAVLSEKYEEYMTELEKKAVVKDSENIAEFLEEEKN